MGSICDYHMCGGICLLSQCLWENPKSVRDFLDAGRAFGVVSFGLVTSGFWLTV